MNAVAQIRLALALDRLNWLETAGRRQIAEQQQRVADLQKQAGKDARTAAEVAADISRASRQQLIQGA